MDSERWQRVRALVESVLDHPVDRASRDALLVQRCGADQELLREARELLAADDENALTPPTPNNVAAALRDASTRDADSACGTRAGPYMLERVIGMGGMGVVYLARRCDVDFEQFVAVKLVKRGMDTDEVVQRFQRERALLATLRHPGIAQLYDGGSTADGRPWLAMEHVEGEPIDRWCDARRASLEQRLALFTRVCAAVAFAHRNMIVHRDLKPSNIFVTAEGAPKLLDFGLAKLLHGDPQLARDLTRADERALTPAYASPEQLRGENLTTATDVYSLGVVLYELLCGARAFEASTPSSPRASPRRMSTRLSAASAALRASDERRLRRALSGDLETIVATALAVEPSARYATVDALAGDVERYLRGLPIEARGESKLYRVKKFAARHRVVVGAALAVMLALVIGLVTSLRAYRTAEAARESERAQRERAEQREREAQLAALRASSALEIVRNIFDAAGNPTEVEPERSVRALLDDFDVSWRERATPDPQVEAAVREMVGSAYISLGLDMQGKSHLERVVELVGASPVNDALALSARLGLVRVRVSEADYHGALSAADELEAQLEGASQLSADEAARLRLGLALRRAQALAQLGDYAQARARAAAAVSLARKLVPVDTRAQIGALATLGACAAKAFELAEAESALREALELHAQSNAPNSLGTAGTQHELAGVLLSTSRLDECQALAEAALELRRTLAGPRHPSTGETLGLLGRTLSERREHARALPLLEESLSIAREALPHEHPNVASAISRLAEARRVARDPQGALPLFREALEIRRQLYSGDHLVVARSLGNLGQCLRQVDQLDEAEQRLREAVEMRRRLGGDEAGLATNLQTLGQVLGARGRNDEYIVLAEEALALLRSILPGSADALASALGVHASLLQNLGRAAESVPLATESLELREAVHGARSPRTARAVSDVGSAFMYVRRLDEAQSHLERALALQREILPTSDPDLALTVERLASCLDMAERDEQSLPYWSEALTLTRGSLGPDHSRTKRVRERYAKTLRDLGRDSEALSLEQTP